MWTYYPGCSTKKMSTKQRTNPVCGVCKQKKHMTIAGVGYVEIAFDMLLTGHKYSQNPGSDKCLQSYQPSSMLEFNAVNMAMYMNTQWLSQREEFA